MSDKACVTAIALLKKLEGLRERAYPDMGGRWTIGYGHAQDVKEGDKISPSMAEILLTKDVVSVWEMIEPFLPSKLTDNQRAALISFTFNVGCGKKAIKDGFLELKGGEKSTLLKLLQERPDDTFKIADEFLHWIYVHGEASSGLCTRRTQERKLFLTPDVPSGPVPDSLPTSHTESGT